MDYSAIKNITLDYLENTEAGDKLEKAFAIYEKSQDALVALSNADESENLTLIKIGTVLSLSIFKKTLSGKNPKDLNQSDWEDIAAAVVDKAIIMDGRDYSRMIFDIYAQYIDVSVRVLMARSPSEKHQKHVDDIRCLAEELRQKADKLDKNEISEVTYVEDCIWISLEAMIKCLSSYIGCIKGDNLNELIYATSTFAFEYGRYKMYKREQELVAGYLKNQRVLDENLKVKLDAYRNELEAESEQFNVLIESAFDPDFRNRLTGSIELARIAGVDEDEILKTNEDIDDFFMN